MQLAQFLAAKFALDERSLDASVRAALVSALDELPARACLDVGAGTGASIERFFDWQVARPWRLTLLERDAGLLAAARERATRLLQARGQTPIETSGSVATDDASVAIDFEHGSIERHAPASRYDAVIAHAVMDLLPLAPTLARFGAWLRAGGLLYASICYDGETVFAPAYDDRAFESELLACYEESMEARRLDGERTGGAYCGRRLLALLPRLGYTIVRAGRSDWHIRPHARRYPDGDGACLGALIDLIVKEGRASGAFAAPRLAHWREDRLRRKANGKLELRVRNCDVLARYVGGNLPDGR